MSKLPRPSAMSRIETRTHIGWSSRIPRTTRYACMSARQRAPKSKRYRRDPEPRVTRSHAGVTCPAGLRRPRATGSAPVSATGASGSLSQSDRPFRKTVIGRAPAAKPATHVRPRSRSACRRRSARKSQRCRARESSATRTGRRESSAAARWRSALGPARRPSARTDS